MLPRTMLVRIDVNHDGDGDHSIQRMLANRTYEVAMRQMHLSFLSVSLVRVDDSGIDGNLLGRLSLVLDATAQVEEVAQMLARTWINFFHERWGHRATVEVTMASSEPAPEGAIRVLTAAGYHFIYERVAPEITYEQQHRALHEYQTKVINLMRKETHR